MNQWSHRVVILMVLVLIGCSGEKVVSPETLRKRTGLLPEWPLKKAV
ncbi:MAG: hypothetical protein KJ727_09125 [Acidobacteria bacterium]|nr:hypothetical protein [Acidobacteriota bacterium]MBU4254740.1 hypothetical protein [Acidobacteriota bacterium]MBU4495998.1 hypothetical protein [Acidobacteriota bacterium]